ncbi:MAG: hypothetical protein E7773_14215 [Sphingomonas sp.]|uniref:hypothetical protein n=1 Tax=Sphingomonas sp. TaxID=28214 RepID=UPI00120ED5F2|nr:hypothetical protein [Sphingomonas sp.]THD34809.1 MAG: hypothetical protein E7773_14215 [Sphingomonas sp.]
MKRFAVIAAVAALLIVDTAAAEDRFDCRNPNESANIVNFDRAAKAVTFTSDLDGKPFDHLAPCAALDMVIHSALGGDVRANRLLASARCGSAVENDVMVANLVGADQSIDVVVTLVFDAVRLRLTTSMRIANHATVLERTCKRL